ncbi:tRNA (guanine-N(7)-)-methyltransferase [Sinobacterium caligoides]|uniref:tRNA (guanine-N(7)-)-methyltransferase n=1 Tax=Sinobacterium caligoides TaxID=933926 RepID=A0A3N2DGL8_9GAMM|nr:tRNA (guanosine(46)-N7)-methyltransferase TrmB [Sinobacterium caligoides]ROR98940.1 tRNA (guanine-N(7)-)-methyltransferase [Sinobacterium caligoides]
MSEEIKRRPIKSFVLRSGRMTDGQRQAFEALQEQRGLFLDDGMIDYAEVFGRTAPVVVEIGFGMGTSLAQMAEEAPEKDFIGIEVHRPGVGRLLSLSELKQLDNVRVYNEDAIQILQQCIPDNSIDTLQLFFPDPWHKARHNKRRILQPEFAQLVRQKLKLGGVFHMATDWEHYSEQMMEVMSAAEGYANQLGEGVFSPRPEHRPITKFETRGTKLGHGVWDLFFEKVS